MLPGQQKLVLTPGQNRKRYLAGARAVNGNDLVFVSSIRKNSDLFLALLEKLRKHHPRARRVHLVLDNYGIHSSRKVGQYLGKEGRNFRLHFLPPYCPEHNDIERLWRKLHANVTRNHRCKTIEELLRQATWYLHREAARLRKLKPMHLKGLSNVRSAA